MCITLFKHVAAVFPHKFPFYFASFLYIVVYKKKLPDVRIYGYLFFFSPLVLILINLFTSKRNFVNNFWFLDKLHNRDVMPIQGAASFSQFIILHPRQKCDDFFTLN